MKDIYKFVKIICDDLSIQKPIIKIVSGFRSKTKLAEYISKSITINILKVYDNKLDLYFSIAHELRHKYQIDNNLFDFDGYKTTNEISLREYNLQKDEIDANAYAMIIMISFFEIQPLFNGMDEDIKEKIRQRANEIVDEI